MVDERQRAERDQVAGGLVARHEKQEGEVQQVFVGQRGPVDLGGGQHRQHVVPRLGPPGGDELLEVSEELADGDERIHLDLGIGVTGARVRPPAELFPVVGRRTEQLGDHPRRQWCRELLGELVGGAGRDVVEDPVDDLAHLRLEDRHLASGESGVDQLAQLTVPRRIREDQVALLHRVRHHRVGDRDALRRGERVRVGRDVPDVLVLEQRPELGDVVPAHRRGGAQFLVRRVGIADEEVGGVQGKRSGQRGLPRTI